MGLTAEGSVWRLSTLGREDRPARKAPGAARMLLPYWAIALGLAGAMQLDLVPVRSWLQLIAPPPSAAEDASGPEPLPPVPEPSPAPLPPPAWDPEPAPVDEPAPTPLEPQPEAPPEPPVRIAEPAPPGPDPIAALKRPPPRRSVPPVRFSHTHRPRAPKLSNLDVDPPAAARPAETPRASSPAPPRRRAARATGSAGGGRSCEAALAAYRETLDPSHPPDLSAGDYAGVLNNGRYFAHCGVPASMAISICVAVQNGQAKGVTVRTSPPSGAKQGCIARAVWGLSFPSHPRMDVARATFK